MFRIAGILSIIQALLYVLAVLFLFFTPQDQLTGKLEPIVHAMEQQPYPQIGFSVSFLLLGLLGFVAVAPATAKAFEKPNKELAQLGKQLALLCLAATTIYFTWWLATMSDSTQLEPADLQALGVILRPPPLNWIAWFTFGGMGVWVLIVGWLSHQMQQPKGLVLASLIKALGFWLILMGSVSGHLSFAYAGAVLGGLIGGPAYHLILGLYLYRYKGDG